MIGLLAGWFAKPLVKYGALLAGVLAIAGAVVYFQTSWFNKGVASGEATVTSAVQTDTIKANENARIKKEKTNEEVRDTPYDARVDGLR